MRVAAVHIDIGRNTPEFDAMMLELDVLRLHFMSCLLDSTHTGAAGVCGAPRDQAAVSDENDESEGHMTG
jgi:hypothetical protein